MTEEIKEDVAQPESEETGEATETEVVELTREEELEQKIAELEAKVQEEKDTALRSLAELENFKRRNQQEVDTFKKYAAEKVVLEFLPILDSFGLACHHAQSEAKGDASVIDGFVLIQKQFEQALERVNVKPIDALDQPFDPNLHQAISQEKVDGKDSGIVVKEMQKGYSLHERVIRPSLVVVSE
jgi:molecular chaperone GrpE